MVITHNYFQLLARLLLMKESGKYLIPSTPHHRKSLLILVRLDLEDELLSSCGRLQLMLRHRYSYYEWLGYRGAAHSNE